MSSQAGWIGGNYPRFAAVLFGIVMSFLIYFWNLLIFHFPEGVGILLAILFFVVYQILVYILCFKKEIKEVGFDNLKNVFKKEMKEVGLDNPKYVSIYLSAFLITLLSVNIIIFKTEMIALINLVFIVLIITIIAYSFGRRYWKNRK